MADHSNSPTACWDAEDARSSFDESTVCTKRFLVSSCSFTEVPVPHIIVPPRPSLASTVRLASPTAQSSNCDDELIDFELSVSLWQMPTYERLSFADVPRTGVFLQQLPSDTSMVDFWRKNMPSNLQALIYDREAQFSQEACKNLACFMWSSLVPYILKMPWLDVHSWLALLLNSSPAFHEPGMNKYASVEYWLDRLFHSDVHRKTTLDSITASFPPEQAKTIGARVQNWPCTENILKDILKMLWVCGHPNKNQALKDAVDIHFANITYTNHPICRLQRYNAVVKFLEEKGWYDARRDDIGKTITNTEDSSSSKPTKSAKPAKSKQKGSVFAPILESTLKYGSEKKKCKVHLCLNFPQEK